MTVLIDEPRWVWRGRLWAHMVSDEHLEELHALASAAGIDRRAFHGDHYDVPDELHATVLTLGAQLVGSRELVRRLRAAGLRLSASDRRRARHVGDLPP